MSKTKHLWILAVAAAATYSALSLLVPYQLDDIFYIDWLSTADKGYLGFVIDHWVSQNGRLGNLICPLLLCVLPKWLFALLTGLCAAALLLFSYNLGTEQTGPDWKTLALFWLVFAFALPWHDNIMVADFALNYLLSGFLTIPFLLLLFKKVPAGIVGLFLAFAAGWSHEGVSVPVLAALSVLLALGRLKLSRERKALLLVYFSGTLVAVASPGLWYRAISSASAEGIGFIGLARTALLTFPAACVLFGLLSACCAVRRWRHLAVKAWCDNVVMLTAMVTVATYAIVVATGASFRGAFFAELLCVISLFRIFIGHIGRTVALLCCLLLTMFYSGVIYWQWRFFSQSERIHELVSGKEGDFFVPLLEYAPWYTLGHIADGEWRNPIQYMALNRHRAACGNGPVMVLPKELSDFKADEADVLYGNCGAVCYKGLILIPHSATLQKMAESQPYGNRCFHAGFRMETISGHEYGICASLRGFKDKNGQLWFLISPDRGYWRAPYKRVEILN